MPHTAGMHKATKMDPMFRKVYLRSVPQRPTTLSTLPPVSQLLIWCCPGYAECHVVVAAGFGLQTGSARHLFERSEALHTTGPSGHDFANTICVGHTQLLCWYIGEFGEDSMRVFFPSGSKRRKILCRSPESTAKRHLGKNELVV